MNNWAQIISENQNRLYRLYGMSGTDHSGSTKFEISLGKPWPYFLYNLKLSDFDSTEFCSFLAAKTEKGDYPPFVKFISPLGSNKPVPNMVSAGYRPVAREKGMALVQNEFKRKQNLSNNIKIRQVTTDNCFELWLRMISRTLFKKEIIDVAPFKLLMNSGRIGLLIAFWKNKPAGTLLFFRDEKVTGLYFISTLQAFQKQGIASKLLDISLQEEFDRGTEKIILHATPQSFYLYKAFGFKEYCNFDIYWKLGH